MVNSSGQSDAMRQALSALMDGDGDEGLPDAACAAWRNDTRARECWHTYHLIGDAMRSDELAAPPARDAAFLSGLRERLAGEPVPMAPRPIASPVAGRIRRRLVAPAAVAAGFVVVAGAVLVARVATTGAEQRAPAMAAAPAPEVVVANGQLIRDARLDRYLAAHRQVSNRVAMQMPGAVVRSVDTIVLESK